MSDDYKTSKEAFVSGMTGSSVGHINMVSLVSLSSIALHSALRSRLPPARNINFLAELLILVLPVLFSVTVFASKPALLCLIVLLPTGVLLLVPRRESGTPLPSSLAQSRGPSPSREPSSGSDAGDTTGNVPSVIVPLPTLTTYRAHMLLLTFICILAVDFPVFPRFLAKCETFGVSIMDLGVGSFIFSQGVVSAIPLIKNPSYLTAPLLGKVITVVRKCFALIILGVLRTISVKGTEYPEHQTEYGTHWNFFITLAFIPVLEVFLHPLMVHIPISLLGVIVAISHQLALSSGGLTDYVLHAPRSSIISENKEGIVSLAGYLAIHLLGLSTGTLLLPPSPSYFRRHLQQLLQTQSGAARSHETSSDSESDEDTPTPRGRSRKQVYQQRRENDKTAIELCSYAVVWWVSLGALKIFNVSGDVSRRMVNLPYIVWVAAFNTSFMLGYLLLDLAFFASPLSKSVYSPTSKLKVHPDPVVLGNNRGGSNEQNAESAPMLLEAINRNGLVLFLLANIGTGLINLLMPTMYMSDRWAMIVLGSYCTIICAVAWTSRGTRLWRFLR